MLNSIALFVPQTAGSLSEYVLSLVVLGKLDSLEIMDIMELQEFTISIISIISSEYFLQHYSRTDSGDYATRRELVDGDWRREL